MSWPRSVRVRLTLWYAGALALVLVLYAALVFGFLERSLHERLDDQVHEDIESAEQMLERTPDGGVRWRPLHHEEAGKEPDKWVEVWSTSGQLLCRDPAKPGTSPFSAAAPAGPAAARSTAIGLEVREMTALCTADGVSVLIRAARLEEPVHRELRELLAILALGLPLAVGAASVGGYLLARRALAPVGKMAERARSISAERLAERLPVENPQDELGQLARVFNETLDRLERSFDQLRRFTADASHELRTPLTALRSVGEVALRGGADVKTAHEVIGSMLEEADCLARLVDSLLTLSRADAGRVKLNPEPTDLAELAHEVAGHLGVLAEERRQTVAVEASGEIRARVDRLVLRQAVINLVDNAIKYSSEGKPIRILVSERSGDSVLEVVDEGPGIAPEHRDRVFDRFYRVDTSRSRELGGTGLGLAISKWAVEANGGRLELASEVGKGSRFRIVLPAQA